MIENKEHIVLVLQLINSKGNTSFLETLGYEFSEIAKYLGFLRKKKYLDFVKGGLQLTTLGKQYLDDLNKELNRKGVSKYISPLMQHRIERSDKFEIYLPVLKDKG
jgi:hypothetical protein